MALNQIDLRNADIGTIAVQGTIRVAKRFPKLTSAYVIGLAVLMFGVGFAVDETTRRVYDTQMREVDKLQFGRLDKAFTRKQQAYDQYYHSKGWFSCDYTCSRNYDTYMRYEQEYKVILAERERLLTKAKKIVGIFSEYGVAQCRQQFWNAWEQGKAMAKRMSFWDAIFIPMNSRNRDEEGIVVLLRFVGQVVMNFTIGLCVNVAAFSYNLIWFVRSFEAGPVGALFFALALCGAFAVLASFILGMGIVAGGGGYMLLKYADRAALQNGGRGQRRRVRYNNRRQGW